MAKLIFGGIESKLPSVSTEQDELVSLIEHKVQKSEEDVTQWEASQAKYHRLRMRIKKNKSFPFVNSSNLRMPTAEIKIRKLKASLMNVLLGIRPIVSVQPTPGGDDDIALKLEKFIDHLVMDVMDIRSKMTIAVDQTLEKGFFLVKPFWRRDIASRMEEINLNELTLGESAQFFTISEEDLLAEVFNRMEIDTHDVVIDENVESVRTAIQKVRNGESVAKFRVQDVTYDFPDIALVEPERCYVPTSSGVDPQECEFVAHEFFMPVDAVRRNAEQKGWDADAVAKIMQFGNDSNPDDKEIKTDKDLREGITSFKKDGLVKIIEYYGYEDIGGGKEKVLITYARDFRLELRRVRLESLSDKFPFVKFYYELINDRWFSHRGIPELLEDIIKEIDVQHNMKIDSQTIRNAPMFIYRSGMINPNMVTMRPNSAIPVKGTQALGDTIQALNFHNPNVEFSYQNEQLLLETKVEEMIGQADFSLQSLINKRQPRTFGEVSLQQQSFQQIFSLDSQMMVDQFSELLQMVVELWSQHGPDDYEFRYFGDSSQGETVKLSREEIQNKYTIKVRGNDNNTNPQVRLQKAQQILAAVTNPLLIQTGVVGSGQIVEGVKEFMKVLDIEDPERFINAQPAPDNSGQEMERMKILKNSLKSMTKAEQAQVLQQLGIDPDLEGRDIDEERERASEEAKILKEVGVGAN